MTLQELQSWIKGAKYWDTINVEEVEEDWIGYNTRIYVKDGRYYAINYYNDHPCEKFGEKGRIRGDYEEPTLVELKSRVVTEWYFTDEEGHDVGVTGRPSSYSVGSGFDESHVYPHKVSEPDKWED